MQRRPRRWWTWGLSIAAGLVVLAATLSLSFRLVMNSVPEYRERLQGLVTQAVGQPVSIGGVALTWQRLRPSLDLRGVALLDAKGEPQLRAERLRLGFALGRLVTGDWMPATVEIYGLDLEADVDQLGHWSLRGLDVGGGGEMDEAQIRRISGLERLRLRDCRLLLHDPQLSPQPLRTVLSDAVLDHHDQQYDLTAQLQPPAEVAGHAALTATMQGDPAHRATWQGRWNVQLDAIRGWPRMAELLQPGTQLALQDAHFGVAGRIEAGNLVEIDIRAAAAVAAATRGNETLARATQLDFEMAAWPEPQAWRAEVRRLGMNGASEPAQLHFHYALTPQGGSVLDAGADGLRLGDVAPWVALWNGLPQSAARLRDARGQLDRLALHLEHAAEGGDNYSLSANLAGGGLEAGPAQAGFSGLDAAVKADQDGGSLELRQSSLQLQLPDAFDKPLPLSELSGSFGWKHVAAAPGIDPGWRIDAPHFDWKALGTTGSGQLGLLLPQQDGAPVQLQLAVDVATDDVTALKPYMPKTWGAGTREWLDRALVHARVPHAHLLLQGPMDDFPFVEKPDGQYQLDIAVADATLAYASGWPDAEKLQAQLHFTGHGLSIACSGAQVGGAGIDRIQAQIPDFRKSRLTIDGVTHGDTARYFTVLRGSPVAKKLEGLLGEADPSGPAAVDLHLDIPLDQDGPPVLVRGNARFDNVTLKLHSLEQPVQKLHGSVAFDDQGASSDGLAGTLYGSAVTGVIRRDADSPDGVLLAQADTPVHGDDGLFAAYTPAWLRQRLDGSLHVSARLPFSGPHNGQLTLNTDLRGVSARLPAPLAKAATDSLPLTVTLGGGSSSKGAADALHLLIDAGEPLRLALRFGRATQAGGGDALLVQAVEVRLGAGDVPRAALDGIFISGVPAEVDLADWSDLIDDIKSAAPDAATANTAAAPADSGLAFRGVDLTTQRLRYHGAVLQQQTHVTAAATAEGWSLQLDGANAQGGFDYQRGGGGHVHARFQKLQLDPLGSMTEEGDSGGTPFDPAQAPTLDVAVDALKLGDADLGHLSLLTSRIDGGQAMDPFKLQGGQLQANIRGTWLRRNASSYADLAFELNGSHLGAVLKGFGYADTMDGRTAKLSGALTWPQQADGLQLAQARGDITLGVDKGVLKAVKPGAGRVLGLFNLYALPKRLLTLDFHDVVSTGLGFDTVGGTFKLADGPAQTDDLKVDAPSMKLEMRGRIGLAARDYDEKITVYPNVTTGVAVGATLIGGPIAGGIALLAQEVFNKPFNTLSRFSYHVTGSWDNPQVKGGDKQELPQTAPGATPAATPGAAPPSVQLPPPQSAPAASDAG